MANVARSFYRSVHQSSDCEHVKQLLDRLKAILDAFQIPLASVAEVSGISAPSKLRRFHDGFNQMFETRFASGRVIFQEWSFGSPSKKIKIVPPDVPKSPSNSPETLDSSPRS
jgi:hypothetical protein